MVFPFTWLKCENIIQSMSISKSNNSWKKSEPKSKGIVGKMWQWKVGETVSPLLMQHWFQRFLNYLHLKPAREPSPSSYLVSPLEYGLQYLF